MDPDAPFATAPMITSRIRDTSGQDRPIVRRGPARAVILVLLGLGAVGAAGFFAWPTLSRWTRADRSFERSRLRFATVARGTLVRDLSVEGRIVASSYPTLYSPAQGTVSLAVHVGDHVEQGQFLATIDSPELTSQVLMERSQLAALEADLAGQEVTNRVTRLTNAQQVELKALEESTARRELARNELANEQGIMTVRELERARDLLEVAVLDHGHAVQKRDLEEEMLEHQMLENRTKVDRQKLILAEAERRVKELEVTSPVSGVVGTLEVDPTDNVIRNQVLMTVIDLSAFEVQIDVPEAFADEIAAGMQVEITYEGNTYLGEVSFVSPEVTNSLVEGRVRFRGEPPTTLKQNQRVSTRVLLYKLEGVLKLRRGPFLESGGGRKVYLVDGDLALLRTVVTGARSLTEVEVTEGLVESDVVIISDTSRFDGAETIFLRN